MLRDLQQFPQRCRQKRCGTEQLIMKPRFRTARRCVLVVEEIPRDVDNGCPCKKIGKKKTKARALTGGGPIMFRQALPACGWLHQDRRCNTNKIASSGTGCPVSVMLAAYSILHCANGFAYQSWCYGFALATWALFAVGRVAFVHAP